MATLAASPAGAAAGTCPVLLGTVDDKLVVSYSTRGAAGPFTNALVLREADLPASFRREALDLSAVKAADDNPAFTLRFQWQFNARDDSGRLDNIRVLGVPLIPPLRFHRADPNGDGTTDLSDAVAVLGFLFLGEPLAAGCEKGADINDSGVLDIADPIGLLEYLFQDGAAPRAPFGGCGVDPTEDTLACPEDPACG
jgi:hypothetical protein